MILLVNGEPLSGERVKSFVLKKIIIKCDAWGTVIKADISSFGLHLFALELNISTNMDFNKGRQ